MGTYYVTFGQRYRHEPHPVLGDAYGSDVPDGWIEITADCYACARARAFGALGERWADIYDAETFDPSYFPAGRLDLPTTEEGGTNG